LATNGDAAKSASPLFFQSWSLLRRGQQASGGSGAFYRKPAGQQATYGSATPKTFKGLQHFQLG
jgi:hypothetical protein